MIELDAASATKGKPIASHVVGIQVAGCIAFFITNSRLGYESNSYLNNLKTMHNILKLLIKLVFRKNKSIKTFLCLILINIPQHII